MKSFRKNLIDRDSCRGVNTANNDFCDAEKVVEVGKRREEVAHPFAEAPHKESDTKPIVEKRPANLFEGGLPFAQGQKSSTKVPTW